MNFPWKSCLIKYLNIFFQYLQNFNLQTHSPRIALKCPSKVWRMVCLISFTVLPRNCSEAVWSNSSAFIILHCATPVTDRGTPWAVSTLSHCGLSVITSRDRRCTSVTNHHAHDHPPTMVTRFVEPQQPPVKKYYKINSVLIRTIQYYFAFELFWILKTNLTLMTDENNQSWLTLQYSVVYRWWFCSPYMA